MAHFLCSCTSAGAEVSTISHDEIFLLASYALVLRRMPYGMHSGLPRARPQVLLCRKVCYR